MGRPSAYCEGKAAASCLSEKGFISQSCFSWRPVAFARPKKRLDLKVRESVCAHIYGRKDKPDVVKCSGSITCHADVEGSPDITLSISNAHAVQQVCVHSCAQRPEISNNSLNLSFSPPIDQFVLARYDIDCSSLPDGGLPFTAEYEALALPDGSASLSLSLQSTAAGFNVPVTQLRALFPLQGWVENSVSCAKFTRSPPVGSFLDVHTGNQAVILTLPPPSSTMYKVTIRVEFECRRNTQTYSAVDIPFIQNTATCALLQFSIPRLISGLTLDSEGILFHPSTSVECAVDMASSSNCDSSGSSQFIVWNKFGTSPR
jgi:hypothetical protein